MIAILSAIHSFILLAAEGASEVDATEVMSLFKENILQPAMLAAVTSLPVVATKYAKKIYSNYEAKSELDSLAKVNEMKSTLLKEIETIVKSAVGSNMQVADKMKENGQKITDEQKKSLNDSAKEIIYGSLPKSLTEENGVLLNIIGDKDKLDKIIDSMMENAVYEYKLKKSNTNNPNVTVIS